MYPTKWQTAILEAVRENGLARISDLARRLEVSDETVRRHVRALVEVGDAHPLPRRGGPG